MTIVEMGNRAASVALMCSVFLLGGCGKPLAELNTEPKLSAVGSGLARPDRGPAAPGEAPPQRTHLRSPAHTGSLWQERGGDLFKDPRARRIGDILTVSISMKDKASFDNSSKRSRDSSHGFGLDISHAMDWRALTSSGSAKADSTMKSSTAQDGKGAIARSENIDLRVATVVTDVLPNGNLLIEGSQELRVNYELRVLTFSGIVNVADIKADNTISHERIAEARMSYGGRGRSMEVQQPGWGHQLVDRLFPF